MSNRYANLVGTNKIKDEYTKINDGFQAVQDDVDGLDTLSVSDRTKLDSVEDGAEPNQNAFTTVNDVVASDPEDTLTVEGATGITVTTNTLNKKVIITATGTSTPGAHGSSHTSEGSDPVPDATATESGLMSAADKVAHDQLVTDVADLDAELTAHEADTTPHATIQGVDKLGLTDATELTISSGAITVTHSYHTVDTEADAATDDLATINGGSQGDILILRQNSNLRDITIKHGTGNIFTWDTTDITMLDNGSTVLLVKAFSTGWQVVGIYGVKRSGDTMTGKLSITQTAADIAKFERTSTGNAVIEVKVSTGSVFYGNSNGSTFAIGDGLDLDNTNGKFKFGTSTNIITLPNGTTHGEITGSPEGVVTAKIGSTRYRLDGGASTTLYVKESGTGNTGWVAK